MYEYKEQFTIISQKSINTTLRNFQQSISKQFYAQGSEMNVIIIYDKNLEQVAKLKGQSSQEHQGDINCLQFCKDDKNLISGNDDGNVCVWDLETLKPSITLHVSYESIYTIALNQENSILLTGGGDNLIKVWSMSPQFSVLKEITLHTDHIRMIKFSQKNDKFISASDDGLLCLWDANQYQVICQVSDIHNRYWNSNIIEFFENDKKIAVAGPATSVTILNTDDLSISKIFDNIHDCDIISVKQFGNQLATGDLNGEIKLFVLDSDDYQYLDDEHSDWIHSIIFDEEQQQLITASQDLKIIKWSLQLNDQNQQ